MSSRSTFNTTRFSQFNVKARCLEGTKLAIRDASVDPCNVYMFGASTSDTGGLNNVAPATVAAYNLIPGTNLRTNNLDAGWMTGSGTIYNTNNRHSDGKNVTDFLAEDCGLRLLNFFDAGAALPLSDGYLVNYSISGGVAATHTAQSALFLSQLAAASGKIVKPQDVFVFTVVGGNDVAGIWAVEPAAGAPQNALIEAHSDEMIAVFQSLYNVGMRNLVLNYVGQASYASRPSALKLEAAIGGSLVQLQDIATIMFDPANPISLIAKLDAALDPTGAPTMPELNVAQWDISEPGAKVLACPAEYGIRQGLPSDVDGPAGARSGAATGFPWPTVLDTLAAPPNSLAVPSNRVDRKALFLDDNHFTQTGHRLLADNFLRFIKPFFGE